MTFDFTDKTVFVAGGTSGINLGVAKAFAQVGAKVSIKSDKNYLYLSLSIVGRNQTACPFRKATETSLKLSEKDQPNGLFALRVRVFEAQIEGFPKNPIDNTEYQANPN